MSRYIKIVAGTFEGFCGIITDEGRDFCGVLGRRLLSLPVSNGLLILPL